MGDYGRVYSHVRWSTPPVLLSTQYVNPFSPPFQSSNKSSVGMYIVARMILGFGIVFCIIAASAMIGELSHPKERAIMTSLFNASYFIGAITASAITIGTVEIASDWSWRVPSILQICPSLLQICFVLYVYVTLGPKVVQCGLTSIQLPTREPPFSYQQGPRRRSLRHSCQVPRRG